MTHPSSEDRGSLRPGHSGTSAEFTCGAPARAPSCRFRLELCGWLDLAGRGPPGRRASSNSRFGGRRPFRGARRSVLSTHAKPVLAGLVPTKLLGGAHSRQRGSGRHGPSEPIGNARSVGAGTRRGANGSACSDAAAPAVGNRSVAPASTRLAACRRTSPAGVLLQVEEMPIHDADLTPTGRPIPPCSSLATLRWAVHSPPAKLDHVPSVSSCHRGSAGRSPTRSWSQNSWR
jgi:hypothetical protein